MRRNSRAFVILLFCLAFGSVMARAPANGIRVQAASGAATPPDWPAPINISNTPDDSQAPRLALMDGGLYVVWVDQAGSGTTKTLRFVERPSGGVWTAPYTVFSSDTLSAELPRLRVANDGAVHLAWEAQDQNTSVIHVYNASRPAGELWSAGEQTSSGANSVLNDLQVDSSGEAHLVWEEEEAVSGVSTLLFASRPAGEVWSAPQTLDTINQVGAQATLVAAADGNLHLLWAHLEGAISAVYYAVQPLGGAWSAPTVVDSEEGFSLQLVEQSGHLYASWGKQKQGGAQLAAYFTEKSSGGVWTAPVIISAAAVDIRSLVLGVDGSGEVHLVWVQDETGSGPENVYYARRPAAGAWRPPVNLTQYGPVSASVSRLRLEVESQGPAHIAWVAQPGEAALQDVYYEGRQTGQECNFPVNISQSGSANPGLSMVSSDSGAGYLIWEDTNTASGDNDIFFAEGQPPEFDCVYLPLVSK